jgi:NitT/TauT family transport system ATP-binding protein
LLEIKGLRKVYGSHGRQVEALRDITFAVDDGQFVCVVGPSGCGKTTLLRCIGGLLGPTAGEARVAGVPVTGPPDGLAVVFQEYGRSLFPWLKVHENVELPLKAKGLPASERKALVGQALAEVGLGDARGAWPWQLSGGMQQRVAIARAQTRAELEDLVRSVWKHFGVTLLFVTHDIDEAVYLGQRVVVLSSSPTVVAEDLTIDLPADRDQLTTRADPRFLELRGRIYSLIQQAKRAV